MKLLLVLVMFVGCSGPSFRGQRPSVSSCSVRDVGEASEVLGSWTLRKL